LVKGRAILKAADPGRKPDPENVREAIAKVPGKLWAVDVASGVESSPGRKDHTRMKQFIEAALLQ